VAHHHPTSAAGITPAYLTGLLGELHPGTWVDAVEIVDAKNYGEAMVSTAARAAVKLRYAPGSPPLPNRLVLKLARGIDDIMAPFYANEVAFYRHIRPELAIEAPQCFGGDFDPVSTHFALVLEDLTARDALFPNVTQRITPDNVRALLDTLADLHARYWESPRFSGDLAWVQTHLAGGVAELMNGMAPVYIQHEIDNEAFKRELVQRLRTTGPELLAGVQAVQRYQASLPQTLLHGDAHLGNTYLLSDGRGGLLDWQLMVRGHAMHDVNYLITTALSIADRRAHEHGLLAHYLDRLAGNGVMAVPSFAEAWREYRRAVIWGVYIGWLTTPVVNYGWEINVLNHLRLTTAYEDHETAKLVAELL
jgi:aminoglycoside/choline kinase family phosphotransferase